MNSVFEGTTQKFTKSMQTFINIRHFHDRKWEEIIRAEYAGLYTSMFDELNFWLSHVEHYNTRKFVPDPPKWIVWTDASDFALGGLIIQLKNETDIVPCTADNILVGHTGKYGQLRSRAAVLADAWPWQYGPAVVRDKYDLEMENVAGSLTCLKSFSPLESVKDSNERELLAILYVIDACKDLFKGSAITLHTDNTNAPIICTKGSSKPRLNKYSVDIANLALRNDFKLSVVWIPQTLNNLADFISTAQDFTDYSITQDFFEKICFDFEMRPNIDLFASDYNAKCKLFFSVTFCPNTLGVDAFNYNWKMMGLGWIFVPPMMILRCIRHMMVSKSEALLLAPQWKSSCFHVLLCDLISTGNVVRKVVYSGTGMFNHGADIRSYFGPNFNANVEVWHIKF
jgi:hypothetical protein